MKENWQKLVEFYINNSGQQFPGLCIALRYMYENDFISLEGKNEIEYEIKNDVHELNRLDPKRIFFGNGGYLFPPFEIISRLEYINQKIKKYSDQSDAEETV